MAPNGFDVNDFYYLAIDTAGKGNGWNIIGTFDYTVNSAEVTFSDTGVYRYRLTTSLDSNASIDPANAAIDSITIVDSTAVIIHPRPVAKASILQTGGYAPFTVTVIDSSTGFVTGRRWTLGDGTTDTAARVTHLYPLAGTYQVKLAVWGPGGSDSCAVGVVSVGDTTRPPAPGDLMVSAPYCSTIVATWTIPACADAESISVNVALTGYADSPQNGDVIHRRASGVVSDTIRLASAGTIAYVRLFTRDRSANWTSAGNAASASVPLVDCRAPAYTLTIAMTSAGDTAAVANITVAASTESGVSLLAGLGVSREAAVAAASAAPYRDMVISSGAVRSPGWWFVAAAVIDSAKNRSSFGFDSVYLKNIPPVVRVSADTAILEDTAWAAAVEVTDFNNDSIVCSLVAGPQSAAMNGLRIIWKPDDADIGSHAFIVAATDARGGVGLDTVRVTVINREEPPVLGFTGDALVNEGSRWYGNFTVSDPDSGDGYTLELFRKPAWVSISGNVVTGTPAEDDAGIDTLRCSVVDRSGLSDTMDLIVTVNNVNDTPVVMSTTVPDTVREKSVFAATVAIYDEDNVDTLIPFWVIPSRWLTAGVPVRDNATRQWTVHLSGTPSQGDTGVAVVVLKFVDRAGAAVILRDTVYVRDIDDPPTRPSITRVVATGAVEYRLRARDDRDSLLTYKVVLNSINGAPLSRQASSTGGVFRFYPLYDGKYLLTASAIDGAGLETEPATDTLSIKGSSNRIFTDTTWEMVSMPAQYESNKLSGTKYLLHWDESVTERQVYHFYQQKAELPMLEPGKSYWRKGSASDSVSVPADQFVVRPVKVALSKTVSGWNQIASPYPYPVVWRGKSNVLWKWNSASGDFEESDSVLDPWCGYWVQSDLADSVAIDTVPVFSSSSFAKRKTNWFSGLNNWVMRAVLVSGSGKDAENSFGIVPEAKDGYDRLDRPEPPRMEARTSLFFPHGNWMHGIVSYASDYRKKWAPINVFEIGISGAAQGGTASIRFEGYTRDQPLHLFMMEDDSVVHLEPGADVTVHTAATDSYKTLFVSDRADIMNRLPLRFNMGNAYPNPFCPSTRISYVLPYRWDKNGKLVTDEYTVSITVYDIKGRSIRNLVYRKMVPGSYEVRWDGKNGSGRIVASGHYYCRLKADRFESVRNLTVVR
jgi:hypothetical protein